MIKATVLADAKILIPNSEHKNFTESADIVEEGSVVDGEIRQIKGLRRGEPFTYKLFATNKNQLIYLNKIKPMEKTEVTLGADAGTTPTVVNMKKAENANRNKFYGAAIGAIAGFLYCKYKKHDNAKTAMYIGGGAVVGFVAGYVIDINKDKVTVKPSK